MELSRSLCALRLVFDILKQRLLFQDALRRNVVYDLLVPCWASTNNNMSEPSDDQALGHLE